MATTNFDAISHKPQSSGRLIKGVIHDHSLKNGDLIELNELNVKSNGGTELATRKMFDVVDRALLEKVQIISGRVREIDASRKRIYWLHDLPLDPECSHLKDPVLRKRFDKIVFVSNWQYQQFRDWLGVPYNHNHVVIENGIDPLNFVEKPKDKIKLIYTSTPHRGLEILVPVFVELAKFNPNIELDVFSSFGIYGWPERDAQFQPLFDICKAHPQINYHGWQPNDVVRKAYEESHIFAYPNIWQETSCRSLIEAMSAGCLCVHPNYGALPETSGGFNIIYDGDDDKNIHANIFAANLAYAIESVHSVQENHLLWIKNYIDIRHSWERIGPKWNALLSAVVNES